MSNPHLSKLQTLIEESAIPFSLDSSESFNAAVDQFIASLDESVQLLGLGEPTHGWEAILHFRNRLFQRLVEAHNFSAIAIESSFPRGKLVNDYVHGAEGNFDDVLSRGLSHGFGGSEANRQLIAWMRESSTKLNFYGCDAPTEMSGADSPRQLLQSALTLVDSIERSRVEALIGDDAAWENPAAMFDPGKSIGLSTNASALRLATEELIKKLTAQEAGDVLHDACQALSLLGYHATMATPSDDRFSKLLGIRDEMMADNLQFVVQRESQRGRVLAFAHNMHLQRSLARWTTMQWLPAGWHVAKSIGQRYAVIGCAIGEWDSLGIGTPEAGTLEAMLMNAPGPMKFLLTRALDVADVPVRSSKNPGYFPLSKQSLSDFDSLVMIG